jgi:hypothetical protein
MSNKMKRGLLRVVLFVAMCIVMGIIAAGSDIHAGDAGWRIFVMIGLGVYYGAAKLTIKGLKWEG